jgi:hypothetical protein
MTGFFFHFPNDTLFFSFPRFNTTPRNQPIIMTTDVFLMPDEQNMVIADDRSLISIYSGHNQITLDEKMAAIKTNTKDCERCDCPPSLRFCQL